MAIALRYSARTDVGLVRSRNEDSGYAGPHLLAVADGMGGHAGGNVASSLVMARLAPLDGDSHGSDDALELLGAAIAQANADLAKAMSADSSLTGMGTTLSAIMRSGPHGLAMVHVGDSRAYLLRDGRFSQITKDHSFVQTLVDSGRISAHEAEHHPQRALVTRVLTGNPEDEPDLTMREAHLGDRYLICSDGLSDYVALDTITAVISSNLTPEDTTKRLIDLALKSGAPDNVTAVVADIVDPSTVPLSVPQIVGAAAERRVGRTPGDTAALAVPAVKAAALRRLATGTAPDDGLVLAEEEPIGRRRWGRILVVCAIVVLALLGGLWAAYDWTQRQYYVGSTGGHVALYRGVPQSLGPWALSSVLQLTAIAVTDLPPLHSRAVTTDLSVTGYDDASAKIRELDAAALKCRRQTALNQICGSTPSEVLPAETSVPVAPVPTRTFSGGDGVPGVPAAASRAKEVPPAAARPSAAARP